MRRRVRAVLIFLLTAGLLAFSLHNADLGGVLAETRRAEPVPLLLALAATFATYALRAWRWQSLLAPIGPTHFSVAFRTTVIGFAASFLLPARAGEVIRPYLLARRERLSATAAFATIMLERLLDLVVGAAAVRVVRVHGRARRRLGRSGAPVAREGRRRDRRGGVRWSVWRCSSRSPVTRNGSAGWRSGSSACSRRGWRGSWRRSWRRSRRAWR